MSEEEKKAVEWFKEDLTKEKEEMRYYNEYKKQVIKRNEKLLNLIENQQKEIEELKANYRRLQNTEAVHHIYITKDKIREKIKNIEDIYKKEMKPYQTKYGLNVSLLSKKEKEELINKRNGLLTQKITLEQLLEGN